MRKGKDLIGKVIIAYDSGKKIETVVDLVFDRDRNCLLGFVVKKAGWFGNAKILPFYLVKALGIDAVIVPSRAAILSSSDCPHIHKILQDDRPLSGMRLVTTDGRDLGKLIDCYFDEKTGIVAGYDVAGGIFADAYSDRSFLPGTPPLKFGRDVAFVPAATISLMVERADGYTAAILAPALSVGDRSPAIAYPHPRPAIATQRTIYPTEEQAAVTQLHAIIPQAIDRDRLRSQKSACPIAVGTPTTRVEFPAGNSATVAGTRLTATATTATDLWLGITATTSDSEARTSALAEKRIRGALGRPTMRAIFDRDGEPILNVGELIGYRAIDSARSAGVLDLLLDSVYVEPPRPGVVR